MPGSANRASTSMSTLPRCFESTRVGGRGTLAPRGAAPPGGPVATFPPLAREFGKHTIAQSITDSAVTLRERLAALYPASSRRTVKQWLEAGRISVNGQVVR